MSNSPTFDAAESPRDSPEPTEEKRDPQDIGLSQGRLIFRRFVRNKVAMVALVVYALIAIFSVTATGFGPIPGWWKYNWVEFSTQTNAGGAPTMSLWPKWLGGPGIEIGDHPFGQDRIGRDYFAQVMRGIQNSIIVMFVIGFVSTLIGTVIGAIAGYYRGWVDAVLMRFTDLVIVIPVIVVGAIVGQAFGALGAPLLALVLGLAFWTGIARLVRAEFFSLREREFVDAARVAGASDMRIVFKHILPNAVGVVIVAATLLMAASILLETGLAFLGYGIRLPDVSLGGLISSNQSAFIERPWLFWWPGLFIIVLALAVNFVGDGLRDAFDPRQRRVVLRKVKD
jgi:peptide/nickel transport system permease protein